MAPGASLYGVKVLSSSGSGYQSWIIAGIDWATANGPGTSKNIKAANMSLGGSGADNDKTCTEDLNTTDAYKKAICGSIARGITYVVAAGNSNADLKGSVPAAYQDVLTVTALSDSNGKPGGNGGSPSCRTSEKDDSPVTFSNYATATSKDASHTIALPGVCIYSTWKGGGYNMISGTSMASSHGAGMATLYLSNNPTATPAQVREKLRNDAQVKDTDNGYRFAGDPNSSPTSQHYDYLGYAGGY